MSRAATITLGAPRRRVHLGSGLVAGCFVLLASAIVLGKVGKVADLAAFLLISSALLALGHRVLLGWQSLVCGVLAVVLFVPIGRFSFPADLPFDLELYRVVIAIVLFGWGLSLLVDESVSVRRTPLDVPVLIIVTAVLGSVVVNFHRVSALESAVLKSITFFLSYVLMYYFLVSTIRTRSAIELTTKLLVVGASVVAFFAMIEQRTHWNIFDRVSVIFPFLRFDQFARELEREGVWRALASSEHPIALGVLFVMVIPIAFSLARSRSRVWWIPTLMLLIGVLATASRTPILAFLTAVLVLVWLRPRDVLRLLPLMIPLALVIKIAVPGSIVTVKNAFFPSGGLIEQQSTLSRESDPLLAGGRLRQLGPMLRLGSRTPVLGQGLGTRQTGIENPLRNAPILDNQWLGFFLDIGLVGIVGWTLLIGICIRRLMDASRTRDGPEGWLAAGYAASLASFAVGMFTYDSMSFTQIAFVFWIIVGLSASFLLTLGKPLGAVQPAEPGPS